MWRTGGVSNFLIGMANAVAKGSTPNDFKDGLRIRRIQMRCQESTRNSGNQTPPEERLGRCGSRKGKDVDALGDRDISIAIGFLSLLSEAENTKKVMAQKGASHRVSSIAMTS